MTDIYHITPAIALLNLQPPIPGYPRFLGAYVCRGEKTAIIDVGPNAALPNLIAGLKELGLAPNDIDYLIATHIHLDHAGGMGDALQEMPKASVVAHPRAHRHLVDPAVLWQSSLKVLGKMAADYGPMAPVPEGRIIDAVDLMELDLGKGLSLQVHFTPGHAPHHISLFDRSDGIVFAGETAGVCIAGATRPGTPPPFDMAAGLASLDRLIALRPTRLCYGHFGCFGDAGARLEAMKRQIVDWHGIVTSLGKTATVEEAVAALRRNGSLAYLDGLSPDEYARDYQLLLNTVQGLMSA